MVIETRFVLGNSTTPSFVTKEFYESFHEYARTMAYETSMRPSTIKYHIPRHMVVEREGVPAPGQYYEMDLDDQFLVPRCIRRTCLENQLMKRRRRGGSFDRLRIFTEILRTEYFLLVPDAQYYNTTLFRDWSVCCLLFEGSIWKFHFRQVFVDPHNTSSTIWFYSHPKYQIEIVTQQDFRGREREMKRSLYALFPRAFRWD